MSLYIGIDVGGTTIKGAIIDRNGKLYGEDSVTTGKGEEIADGIEVICNRRRGSRRSKIRRGKELQRQRTRYPRDRSRRGNSYRRKTFRRK